MSKNPVPKGLRRIKGLHLMRDVGQSDDNKPEERAQHFWSFGFCGSQIFWILDSQMLTIEKPEDRARPGRAIDSCICATGVVRALCCSEEVPEYCQFNVLQVEVDFRNSQVP